MMRLVVALAVLLALSACTEVESPATQAVSAEASVNTVPQSPSTVLPTPASYEESLCFAQANADQERQLRELVEASGEVARAQNVCVIEPDGQGGYAEVHYTEGDFANYLLYALLLQNSRNTLFTYGVIGSEISVLDYLTLSLMTGVDKYGSLSQPFTKDLSDGSWSRIKSDLGLRASTVRYGASAPKPQTATRPAPPAGTSYTTQPLPPAKGSATRSGTNAGERQSKSPTSRTTSGTTGSTKRGK